MRLSVVFSVVLMGIVVVAQADRRDPQHWSVSWNQHWNQYADQRQTASQQGSLNQQENTPVFQQAVLLQANQQQGNPQASQPGNSRPGQQGSQQQVTSQTSSQANQQQVSSQASQQANQQQGNSRPGQQGNTQTTQQQQLGNVQTTQQQGNVQTTQPQGNTQTTQQQGNVQTTQQQGNVQTTQHQGNTQIGPQSNTRPNQQGNSQTNPQPGNTQTTQLQGNVQTTQQQGNLQTIQQQGNTQTGQQSNTRPSQQGSSQTNLQQGNPQTVNSQTNQQTTQQHGNWQTSQQQVNSPTSQLQGNVQTIQQLGSSPGGQPWNQHGNEHEHEHGNENGNHHEGHNEHHGEDHDYDHNRIPIPIISDKAASAIVKASSMLTDALKAAAAEEVYDKTGVLTIIRTLTTEAITAMNTLFTEVSGAVSDRITRNRGPEDPLSELLEKVERSVREIKRVLRSLEGKIKPSELSDIENALEDIVRKVLNLKIFKPKRDRPTGGPFQFDQPERHEEAEPINTHYHHGLNLQAVIDDWATAIEGIASAVQTLAKAIQKVITTRTLAITIQKSIHKSLALSGSSLNSVSKQLNSGLESLKSRLGKFAQMTVTQLNQAYSSITSNPTKWHHRLLSKLFDFLAAYSDYVHRDYVRKIASSINEAELDIASEIIKQTRKSGLEIAQAATHISDKAAASFNHQTASECALKYIPKLMEASNSLGRFAQCVTGEGNNFNGLSTRGQQSLTQAKDNAANIVNQLMVCNSGTDQCYNRFSDVFDHKKSRAREDLRKAAEQITDALQTISKRIENCLEVVAEEIKANSKKSKKDFDFCVRF